MDISSNIPVFSVSQISAEVRRTVEEKFEMVRIRGEVSRPTRARSGHFYMTLKDERAVIDAVAWKGVAAKFPFDVSEGMELIATGKLTTYPGQSKYQLIVESLELAGEGALLKMLEDRRKALMAEGLFDPERKQPLPRLPRSIGVVSSPSGAVIRDIWHRVRDRCPLPVLLWPTLVQGQRAAEQVAAAIRGMSQLPDHLRPDVLIVARGGGSLEDLWCFNEEVVIRAAAACPIPLISAIGHETDTTLLDYVADVRAPTPTGAAEMAVPVRQELINMIEDGERRLRLAAQAQVSRRAQTLEDLSRSLLSPERALDSRNQDLDMSAERLHRAVKDSLSRQLNDLSALCARLPAPAQSLRAKAQRLADLQSDKRLLAASNRALGKGQEALGGLWARFEADERVRTNLRRQGWVTVSDSKGQTLKSAMQIRPKAMISLQFHDGNAIVTGLGPEEKVVKPAPKSASKAAASHKTDSEPQAGDPPAQESLF